MNSVEQNRDAQRYRILKDYLLRNGFIHYVALVSCPNGSCNKSW